MNGTPPPPLTRLAALSRIDSSLFALTSERKRIEAQLKERELAVERRAAEWQLREQHLLERRRRCDREEKALNEERQKLVDRRKALSSFGNYKIQEAAQREIDASADALNAQEEALLLEIEQIEGVDAEVKKGAEALGQLRAELSAEREEAVGTIATLDERLARKRGEREGIVVELDQVVATTYRKALERYPQNPVVAVVDRTCSGCYQTLVAQTMVQISRGESIIKCPGCGRILCLPEHLGESKEAGGE